MSTMRGAPGSKENPGDRNLETRIAVRTQLKEPIANGDAMLAIVRRHQRWRQDPDSNKKGQSAYEMGRAREFGSIEVDRQTSPHQL